MTNKSDDILNIAKEQFDDSVENLAADVKAQIAQARNHALTKGQKKFNFTNKYTVTGLITASLIAAIIINSPNKETETLLIEDLEMFTSSDELEFYEDLEFFLWLEEHEISS